MDIFLEELSTDRETGEIRGSYLTVLNLGIMLGPLTLAFLAKESLQPVYLTAALLLSLTFVLAFFLKSPTPKRHGLHHHALLPFKQWWRTKSVRRATLAKLSLEAFFALMVIFTPLYLHEVLGFDWTTLGVMFTIMLVPFVLFQWIVGKLADRYFGEKEFMIIGFLLIGGTLLYMPTLGASALAWTIVLFLSRVGASLIEVTADSYFFKHVDARDTGLLSIYRLARPASIVLGATIGAIALNLFSFEKIFFVVAAVIFFGLKESLLLRDTL